MTISSIDATSVAGRAMNGEFLLMRIRLPGAASKLALQYYDPAPDLRGLISSYYLFRADLPQVADLMRADLGQLRFMLRGTGSYTLGGLAYETPDICLLGSSTASTRFDVVGPLLVFGIGLQPAGWASLVRDDASLLANRAVDAVARFGPLLDDALDALRHAPDGHAMVSIADVVMRAIKTRSVDAPLGITRLTDQWLTGALNPNVDALVADLGVSGRHAERLIKRIYGAPPKLLARKYRALRAASLIGTRQLHWSDAVGDAFFDQSHFIRDFKRFTGLTPSQFQKDPPPVTRLTLLRRGITSGNATLARVS